MKFFQRLIRGPPERADREPFDSSRRRELIKSYAVDWAVTISLCIVFALIDRAMGFKRQFSVNDPSIQHTFAVKERVPFWAAVVIAGLVPILAIVSLSGVWLRSAFDTHQSLLGLILSLAITTTLTDITKLTVGRARPDLLARCILPLGTVDKIPYGLVEYSLCTQTNLGILDDGFKSFFSGHASFSFSGLGFLSLYLAGKMRLFDRRGHVAKMWVAITPLVVAALVAISRTMDYRHHASDVVIGGLVGFLISLFSYSLYFPLPWRENCHKPYSPRIARMEKTREGDVSEGAAGSVPLGTTNPFGETGRLGYSSGGTQEWEAVRNSEDRDTRKVDPTNNV